MSIGKAPEATDLHTSFTGAQTRVVSINWCIRKGDEVTAQDERVWLHVRDAGGWWRPDEVKQALNLDLRPGWSPLARLFNRCHLSRRRVPSPYGGQRVWAYGVTAACTPLQGFTLDPATPLQAAA